MTLSGLNTGKNSKNRAIRFHVGHILMYVVLYGIALFFYLFLYGYMQYVILGVMTLLPVVSIVSVFFLSRRCDVRMTISGKRVERRESFAVGILLDNPTILTSFAAKCRVRVENLFYQTNAEMITEIPMVLRGESSTVIPLIPERNGLVQITVMNIEISDFCGLLSVVIPVEKNQLVQVFPEKIEIAEAEKVGFYTGMSNNEEDIPKGNDYADTSNIREYVPGDRMKDIHWKLSAKKEMLLVKERVRMSENQMVLFLELSGSHEQMDEIIRFCYNLICVCLQDSILVKLLWCDKDKGLTKTVIGNREDLQEAFVQLFYSGIGKIAERAESLTQIIPAEDGTVVRKFVKVGLRMEERSRSD